MVFTTDDDFSPEEGDSRTVVYDHVFALDAPAQAGVVNINLPAGHYFCRVGVTSHVQLVDAYGNPDVWSEYAEVEVP